jgi:long-chain acyl-CoA synthetase
MGNTDEGLKPMNLYDLFAETARQQPDHAAILGPRPHDHITYKALDEAISLVATQMQRAGVRSGDCVGLHCPSGADYIIHTYAVWKCGGCVVPIPTELTAPEKQEILREISLSYVISEKRSAGFAEQHLKRDGIEIGPKAMLLKVVAGCEHPAGFSSINSAFIRFTSGTTGTSKGVVLSHETIKDRIDAANDILLIGPADRVVWLLSMSYHFAVSIVSYLSFGAGVVLVPNNFAQAIVTAARTHGATLIYGSPAHYAWMASYQAGGPLSRLRLAVSTTTALDGSTPAQFQERYGLPVTQALGIIEIGLPFINVDFAADRPEAIGRLLPAYRMRLEDVGLGANARELYLSGKGFLDAYYRPWRTRAEIMPDGWFRTGDVAEVDADGCVFLRGRTKDVINVMGMKLFPQEVEAVLISHPAVKDACVVASPDSRLGEVPVAKVMLVEGGLQVAESDLLEHCKRQLADYKVPQRIEMVKELWRTASGKVIRRATMKANHE